MLSALKRLFEQTLAEPEQPENEAELIAAAATTLLLEVAWADHELTSDELQRVKSGVQSLYGLADSLVDTLIADARQRHEASVGVYEYTRTLNGGLDADEKVALLVQLWRLALADDELHAMEEHVIRRISELLYVPHSRFIAAKQQAREAQGAG